jgi:ErfK/YbiS/YcfS/YnhG.
MMRKMLIAASAFLSLQFAPVLAEAGMLTAKINISTQTMTVSQNGFVKYRWKVSTARKGYVTPVGSYSAKWASKNHRSRKYDNAPMPFAIFFKGGYAVHATYDLKRLAGVPRLHTPASGQCGALLLDPPSRTASAIPPLLITR